MCASSDGFCSVVRFEEGELGDRYVKEGDVGLEKVDRMDVDIVECMETVKVASVHVPNVIIPRRKEEPILIE
jgi:hypothetical protein